MERIAACIHNHTLQERGRGGKRPGEGLRISLPFKKVRTAAASGIETYRNFYVFFFCDGEHFKHCVGTLNRKRWKRIKNCDEGHRLYTYSNSMEAFSMLLGRLRNLCKLMVNAIVFAKKKLRACSEICIGITTVQ